LKNINYKAYEGRTSATKDRHIYTIEKYMGADKSGTHKYKVRFVECGRVKTVSYRQIQSGSITYSFRKPKITTSPKKKKVVKQKEVINKNIPSKTIIMGLDASSQKTGYSIFQDGKLLHYGLISKSHKDKIHRISQMVQEIFYRFQEYKCEYVVMEDIYFDNSKFSSVKTIIALANLQG